MQACFSQQAFDSGSVQVLQIEAIHELLVCLFIHIHNMQVCFALSATVKFTTAAVRDTIRNWQYNLLNFPPLHQPRSYKKHIRTIYRNVMIRVKSCNSRGIPTVKHCWNSCLLFWCMSLLKAIQKAALWSGQEAMQLVHTYIKALYQVRNPYNWSSSKHFQFRGCKNIFTRSGTVQIFTYDMFVIKTNSKENYKSNNNIETLSIVVIFRRKTVAKS